jgi:hypothetical protein
MWQADWSMLAPLVVLVIILYPAPSGPTLAAFEQAARQLMGTSAELRTQHLEEPISDDEALALGGDADGVVQLEWNANGEEVRLRSYLSRERRWLERRISFSQTDPDYDRGRLLGLLVGSMFTRIPAEERQPAQPEPQRLGSSPERAAAAQPPLVVAQDTGSPPEPARSGRAGMALEFSALATSGFGASGDALGARAALSFKTWRRLRLRCTFALRTGEIPEAESTTTSGLASVGLDLPLLPTGGAWNLRVRADLLGGWLSATHFSSDDPTPVRRVREQFGGDLLAVFDLRITDTLGVFASGGVESMLGATDFYTHGQRVTTIPRALGLFELGVRTAF